MCVRGRNVGVIARGTAGGREPVGLFFAMIWSCICCCMGLHWLPATALKTPMSVYVTLVLCANSTNLTSSCSLAFIADEFPRLPILSKLMGYTMRSTSLSALLRQTKVSPVQASLGPKSMTAMSKV